MSVRTFRNSQLYEDLVEAIHAEYFRSLYDCVPRDSLPEHPDERYRIAGYPLPPNPPRCWCPEGAAKKCENWHSNCIRRSIRRAGKDFQIIKCTGDHDRQDGKGCDRTRCWSYVEVVSDWVELVCKAIGRKGYTTPLDEDLQADVKAVVVGYLGIEDRVDSYVNIICLIIQELRLPSRRINLSWMPELHGVLWLEEKSIAGVVDLMMWRLGEAKRERVKMEAKERRRRSRHRRRE